MRVVVMALALTLGFGFAAFAGDDEAAIRKVYDDTVAAWDKGDYKAMLADYDKDAVWTFSSGVTKRGHEALEKHYAELFAGKYKGTTMKLTIASIRFVTPDVAVVDGTWEASNLRSPEGKELPPVKGLLMNTLVSKDGKWLSVAMQTMVAPPPPSAEK